MDFTLVSLYADTNLNLPSIFNTREPRECISAQINLWTYEDVHNHGIPSFSSFRSQFDPWKHRNYSSQDSVRILCLIFLEREREKRREE